MRIAWAHKRGLRSVEKCNEVFPGLLQGQCCEVHIPLINEVHESLTLAELAKVSHDQSHKCGNVFRYGEEMRFPSAVTTPQQSSQL